MPNIKVNNKLVNFSGKLVKAENLPANSQETISDVSWVLNFTGGSSGDIITTSILNSSTNGTTSGSWSYSNGAATHTKLSNSTIPIRYSALRAGSSVFQTPSMLCIFDTDQRIALSDDWEGFDLFFSGVNTGNYTITALIRFDNLGGESQANIDILNISSNFFAVSQQQVQTGFNYIKAHGQINGGASTLGAGISIISGQWYIVTVRYNTTAQQVEVAVINNDTGILVGESIAGLGSGTTSMVYFRFSDYLLAAASGNIKVAMIAGDINAGYPLAAYSIPNVSATLEQIISGSIRLNWSSVVVKFRIEKQVNGGAWSDIFSPYYDSSNGGYTFFYDDSSISDGSNYTYRITPLMANGIYGTPITTNTITVNNSQYPVISDDFNSIPFAADLNTRTNWSASTNCYFGWSGGTIRNTDKGTNYWSGNTPNSNHMTEVTISTFDTAAAGGPAVRCQSGAMTCYALASNVVNNTVDLIIVNSGTRTLIQNNGSYTYANGIKLRISATGSGSSTRLNGYIDTGSGWTQIFTNVDPGTGNYIDNGYWGLYSESGAVNNVLDNFKGYNL